MISRNPNNSETLSDREKDVIVSLVQGMTNKEIADHLCISINTVITHRRNIARKLQIPQPRRPDDICHCEQSGGHIFCETLKEDLKRS